MIRFIVSRLIKKMHISAIRNSEIHPTSVIESSCRIIDSTFNAHSFCGEDCMIINANIGSFCSIADHVCIGGAGHPIKYVSTSPVFLSHRDSVKTKYSSHKYVDLQKTYIGNDVWIGFGAMIKSGINIGNGAIVGMGAVVTKNVEPYAIVAGNPARIIKMRFVTEIINALQESKWWEMSENDLKYYAPMFNDPEKFLKSKGLI